MGEGVRVQLWVTMGMLGCSSTAGTPLIEAHRAGAGYWPQNSASAVNGAIRSGFEGLEVDLGLTRDGVAVLHHDPFLSSPSCSRANGAELSERVRLDQLRLGRLQDTYVCGGAPDPDFPGAEVVAEPVMAFPEFLAMLEGADSRMQVHLDVKFEPGWTRPAEDFAQAILDPWWASELPQPLVVTANTSVALVAFENHARVNGRDLTTLRIHPLAPVDSSAVAVGLGAEADRLLGKADYLALIDEAQADGIAVNFEVAEREQLAWVQAAGFQTALWTVNEADALRFYAQWPVDFLITDYPARWWP